jgi:hypothetical protein
LELAPLRSLSDESAARFTGFRASLRPRSSRARLSARSVPRLSARRHLSCASVPAPQAALLRFPLPSASPPPGAPFGEVASPAGSAFRLSRPLGGLRCPGSSRPSFVPLSLLGFALQSFVPSRNPCSSRSRCSPAVGRAALSPTSFPGSHHRRPPRGRAEAGPPREGPLRLAVPRRRLFARVTRPLARLLFRAADDPFRVEPFRAAGRRSRATRHGVGRFPGFFRSAVLPPLRSVAPPGNPFRSSAGGPANDGRCSPGLLFPSRAFPLPALGLEATPATARRRCPLRPP